MKKNKTFDTNKKFLGFINSLLCNWGIKINKSQKCGKMIDGKREKLNFYSLEIDSKLKFYL